MKDLFWIIAVASGLLLTGLVVIFIFVSAPHILRRLGWVGIGIFTVIGVISFWRYKRERF